MPILSTRSRRASLGCAAAALALLSPAAAHADSDGSIRGGIFETDAGYGEPLTPDNIRLRTGTVRYEVMRQASATNAQVYGAIGAFDRYVRPRLSLIKTDESVRKTTFYASYDLNQAYGVSEALGLCSGTESYCDGRPRRYSLDLYSLSASLVWGDQKSGFFMVGSYSLANVPPPERSRQAISRALMLTMMGPFMFPYRVLGKKAFNYIMPGAADAILGYYLNTGPVQGYVGYIASQGLFTDLAAPPLKAFASAAVANEFEQLALLRGGLRDLVLPLAEEAEKRVGRTAAYVRRIQVVAPRATAPDTDLQDVPKTSQIGLTSLHLEQVDLGAHFDVRAAYGFTPTPFLHEARVAAHTANFRRHATLASPDKELGYVGHWGGSAMLGVASMPDLPFYGVEGGPRFSFNVEAGYFDKFGRFLAYVRMNDPEFLTAFPFAYNALSLGVALILRDDR